MNYTFDVFVSYSRSRLWPEWVEKTFQPLFLHWLEAELGKEARVFFDFDIETGANWPKELARCISGSAILVPLWSKNYFNSKWCTTELGHMVTRQKNLAPLALRSTIELIAPLVIHDGDNFPAAINTMQRLNISKHVNVVTEERGKTHEELSNALRTWMPQLVRRINSAPPCNPAWQNLATNNFIKTYYDAKPKQRTIPRV